MSRVKQRIFCGAVCEQIIYNIGDSADIRTEKPRKPRFENEEDRAAHREAISRKKNERLINANFSPASLYSTLTFDLDSEVHTVAECKRERDNFTAAYYINIRRRRSIWCTARASTQGASTCT